MDLSQQSNVSTFEYAIWVPPPGDLPYPGIEPTSPVLQADSLSNEQLAKPTYFQVSI